MTRREAIAEAVIEIVGDDQDFDEMTAELRASEDEEEGRLIIHRAIEGRHDACSERCWCVPHVFTRDEALRMSDDEIVALCERRERRN